MTHIDQVEALAKEALGCGTLSVKPKKPPTRAQIEEVQKRVAAEVTYEMLTCLVKREIPK